MIAVNDDYNHRVVIIDPRTKRIVWQYGHRGAAGTAHGYLNTPDGFDFVPVTPAGKPDYRWAKKTAADTTATRTTARNRRTSTTTTATPAATSASLS